MDISSLSVSALQMTVGRSQQDLTISMIKMAAAQQNQITNILAQNAQQVSQADNSYQFSIRV